MKGVLSLILDNFKLESLNDVSDLIQEIKSVKGDNLLSMSAFLDGVKLFNKTNDQLWPIFIKLNNIKLDSKIVLIGCYVGQSKPEVEFYLSKFIDFLNDVYENGIEIGAGGIVYSVIKNFVVDMQAKLHVMEHGVFKGNEFDKIKFCYFKSNSFDLF